MQTFYYYIGDFQKFLSDNSSDIIALIGTLGAALIGAFALIYTANKGKEKVIEPKPPSIGHDSGYKYVNVGEGEGQRSWKDCVRYGFISAGQGDIFQKAIKKLKVGDRIYAYISGHGYVGFGKVAERAVPIKDFKVGHKKLLEMDLESSGLDRNVNDPALTEWTAKVNWLKTFPKEEARSYSGIFANPNVVCRLRDTKTLNYLKEEFNK